MRSKKIEIGGDELAQPFARRRLLARRLIYAVAQLSQKIFQHRAMQMSLVAEIVVKHRLVRVRRRGDLLRACPSQPLRRKMLLGGGQDAPRRGWILDFPSSASHRFDPSVLSAVSARRSTTSLPWCTWEKSHAGGIACRFP